MMETPVVETLTFHEIQRYSRHIILPEVGLEGQTKLKNAKVLLVGTGGLGSPIALYLAAAGVGTIGLIDFDVVDETNLQRQIIHSTDYVGKPKIDSATQRIKGINPYVNVVTYNQPLTAENALAVIEGYDIVCDGTDNYQTRYLVNDACVLLGIPNVYGSIFQFEGQASVFDPNKGPCYRCLYPNPPPLGLVPSCAEGGVFGILPGTIGTIQATEIIKLILNVGDPLIGRLLIYDALEMKFRELKVQKNPDCPICGNNPTIKGLIDYEAFCGITSVETDRITEDHLITPKEYAELRNSGFKHLLIDVRNPMEQQISKIEGSRLIPLRQLEDLIIKENIPKDFPIILHCKTGGRSARALIQLLDMGYTNVKHLVGGINSWIREIDKNQPLY